MKKIAVVVQLPQKVSPGQRFRFEQYEALLSANGYQIKTFSFFDLSAYKILYQRAYILKKVLGVMKGFAERFKLLFALEPFDYVFLQREFAPIGPPIFEFIVSKVLGKKIIYDFDDAIWIPNVTEGNGAARLVKCFWKIKYICKWSYKISAGNAYLATYARQYNKNVFIIPTSVDTEARFNTLKFQDSTPPVIGWTGSHSTLKYLDELVPVLTRLHDNFLFRFLVICDRPPLFTLPNLDFLSWNETSEIKDLLQINIGVMPLPNDAWSEGKCGFKIIQYLSLGIPAVASPVGVNRQLIQDATTGCTATTPEEWYEALASLLQNAGARAEMGRAGRALIEREYSLKANASNFLSLFS